MAEVKPDPLGLTSIRSIGSTHLDVEDHEVDLQAIASNVISIGGVGQTLTAEQKFYILKRINLDGLITLEDLPVGATFMIEKIEKLSEQDALDILKEAIIEHADDVNIPTEEFDLYVRLVEQAPINIQSTTGGIKADLARGFDAESEEKSASLEKNEAEVEATTVSSLEDGGSHDAFVDWGLQTRVEAALIAYHSPYPEVRAVTDPYDDPNIPVETIRVYILGIIWTGIGTFINQFFSQRRPAITLDTAVVQLFLYPSGRLLQYILPKWKFKIWKYEIDLNPGPWNHKEQMLATVFYAVSGGNSYVSYNIHVQKLPMFYDNQWADFGYQTLLILSTNFLGFGFAGIMRKFCIYPIRSIWPSILPTVALNKALMQPERKENINGWTISKYKFFFVVFASSFFYFWLPNYLFGILSTFNWMTWIAPENLNLAMITGSVGGLGFNPIPSFDWNTLNFNAALNIPFYSQLNQYIGSFLGFFCIIALNYSNYMWSAFVPINSNSLFTNLGTVYDVKKIVNKNSLFDKEKFAEVGPPYYSSASLITYGAFFAAYPFLIVYECAMNYKGMWSALRGLSKSIKNFRRSTYHGFNDPHSRMMARYKEVPDWVFLFVLVVSIVLAIICVKIYPAQTPVWTIFFAVGINFLFLIPLTTLYSVTGFQIGLNVLVELIIGYALPGNGLALNFVKALGYNIDAQAQNYISDQKMGHYVKLPPRAMFRAQTLSVLIHSFIGLAVMNFQINNIANYCETTNKQKFSCPGAKTFYNASIQWGVIGPKKVFDGVYPIFQYCFLIGFLLALVCIPFKWYGPKKLTKYFQPTLIIGGFIIYAPYNLTYYTGGLYLSFASMYYLKKKYTAFWEKYNYVFSGAMTAGVAFSAIIIFFSVQYVDRSIEWWGNDVVYGGVDYLMRGRLNVTEEAPEGYFGLRKGNFP